MNHDEAIDILNRCQPLPDDSQLTEEQIREYDEARKHFLENPSPACIPLFLNSFGAGNGHGVYQLIDDVMAKHSTEDVVPVLASALTSSSPSIRYWNAQIAARFPSEGLVLPLANVLHDSNHDTKYAAVTALENIGGNSVRDALQKALESEDDEEIKELIEEVLEDL